jgi:hypothetical protein
MRSTSAQTITPPESGRRENAAMKTPVKKDGSPSGTTPDTDASNKIQTVTRGRCGRIRPIIKSRFATDTMSDLRADSERDLMRDF